MNEQNTKTKMNVNWSWPRSDEYTYETFMERINMDEEREKDLLTDNGFIVSNPQSIKKTVKDPDGIFSTKFGQSLNDIHPFALRYRCSCGHLNARLQHGIKCPICNTEVRYVDDNFKYFGWIVLKDYYLIHQNLYKSLAFFIGNAKLERILEFKKEPDGNGIIMDAVEEAPKDEPFFGIGMIEFKERFKEIMDFYLTKNPDKREYYDDIMENIDKVFIQSVPVYTTLLRPYRIEGDVFHFEGTNKIYRMLVQHAYDINKSETQMDKAKKPKNQLLWNMQQKLNELYYELTNIISGKKGSIRTLFGGRYNFTARAVIVPNPKLKIDQVTLPYKALLELLQQTIINILKRSYNMSYSDAYKEWSKAQMDRSSRVYEIIDTIIKDRGGIPVLINRNPTIGYGGILQMFCVAATDTYTMGMPLQILKPLGADFDGDTMNILYIINQQFFEAANRAFNPRNALYISRNDGYFNNQVNHCRDTLITANAMIYQSRYNYSEDQKAQIAKLKAVK